MSHLVALQLPPSELAEKLGELHDRGIGAAPLDPDAPPAVRDELLARLRPHAIIDADGPRELAEPADVDDDVALVVATSGASGAAKLVELPAAAVDAATAASQQRLRARPGWRWLCCLPTHHVGGLQVLARAHASATTPVIHDRFDAEAVAGALADVDATALVPTQLRRLLEAGADLSRLQALVVGGGPVDAGLAAEAAAAGAPLVATYGATETCGGCVYDGRPLDGVKVALDDDGRIHVRGAVLMRRYRGEPERTAAALADGWLATADRGRWTDDGRLEVLGRADDVIVTGGENVAADAVAAALTAVDGVVDAAVAGEADPEWGERVVAWIVVGDGDRGGAGDGAGADAGDDALRAAVAERVGAHAVPKAIRRVPALPRTALGKLDRARLASLEG